MPTPAGVEFIELLDGAETLHCGTLAIRCRNWSGLFAVGDSRGSNRVIPGAPGRRKRHHVRDELTVELEFQINGAFDENGILQTSGRRARCLIFVDQVRRFLDGADGRQLQVRLTTPAGTSTGDITFKAMSRRIRFPGVEIAEFEILVTLPDGLLPLPGSS